MSPPAAGRQGGEGSDRLEVVVAAFLVAAAGFLVWQAVQLPAVSRGALSTGPGPGLFPSVTASLLLLLATGQLVSSLRRDGWANRTNPVEPIVYRVVAVLTVAVALLKTLGFFVDMVLMVAVLMWLFGERRGRLVAVVALSAGMVSFLVFGELFGVRLPKLGIPLGPWTL